MGNAQWASAKAGAEFDKDHSWPLFPGSRLTQEASIIVLMDLLQDADMNDKQFSKVLNVLKLHTKGEHKIPHLQSLYKSSKYKLVSNIHLIPATWHENTPSDCEKYPFIHFICDSVKFWKGVHMTEEIKNCKFFWRAGNWLMLVAKGRSNT